MSASDSDNSRTRNVKFSEVQVYYFDREQSLCTVPSDGDAALGMGMEHFAEEKVSIDERDEHHLIQRFVTAGKLLRQGVMQLPKWVHTKLKPFSCTQAANLSLSLSPTKSAIACRTPEKRKFSDAMFATAKAATEDKTESETDVGDEVAIDPSNHAQCSNSRAATKAKKADVPIKIDQKTRTYFEDKNLTYQLSEEERKLLLAENNVDMRCESPAASAASSDSILMKEENGTPTKRTKAEQGVDAESAETEDDSLDRLRVCRLSVGCKCLGGKCNARTCECARNGIQCLVESDFDPDITDQDSSSSSSDASVENTKRRRARPQPVETFTSPCRCGWTPCTNPNGKRIFDFNRVRKHYEHTLGKQREERRAAARQKVVAKRKGRVGEANLLDDSAPARRHQHGDPDSNAGDLGQKADASFDIDCSICRQHFDQLACDSNSESNTTVETSARTSTPKRKKLAQTKS